MKFNEMIGKAQDVSGTLPGMEVVKEPTGEYKDITVDSAKCDPTQQEALPTKQWKTDAVAYATAMGIKVELHLKDAMLGRLHGQRVLSLREADIANRQKITLKSDFLWAALHVPATPMLICEDDWEKDDDVYMLRTRYNAGVRWRKEKRCGCSPEVVANGDRLLEELPKQLTELGLPLHAYEYQEGFDELLLKPEWGYPHTSLQRQKALEKKLNLEQKR